MGATIGVGIAFRGPSTVQWGDATHGVWSIVLSWLVSPLISGVLGALFFTITKFAVLKAPDPARRSARPAAAPAANPVFRVRAPIDA